MFMFPELKEVCCIIIPGDSLSTMLMLLEFIAAFSPSSSRVTASIRVGMVSIVLEERVAETLLLQALHGFHDNNNRFTI